MKYYLIIGYQTLGKFKKYPKIAIYHNDFLLDEFDANNEEYTHISTNLNIGVKAYPWYREIQNYFTTGWWVDAHDPDKNIPHTFELNVPKKYKVVELDESVFSKDKVGKLKIQVKGGPTNYTNGFVTKTNTLLIFPVFLIPEIFFDTKLNLPEKVFTKNKNFFHKFVTRTKDYYMRMQSFPFYNSRNLWIEINGQLKKGKSFHDAVVQDKQLQWPGPNYCENADQKGRYFILGSDIGQDFAMQFYIHRKHKIYSLQAFEDAPIGYFQLNLVYSCMLSKLKLLIDNFNK